MVGEDEVCDVLGGVREDVVGALAQAVHESLYVVRPVRDRIGKNVGRSTRNRAAKYLSQAAASTISYSGTPQPSSLPFSSIA